MAFKKYYDRLISAGTTAANAVMHGPEQAEKIRHLESMGFAPERARHALNATDGDVDRAAELLLLGANERQDATAPVSPARRAAGNDRRRDDRGLEGAHVAAHNDEQMRRAIEESLMVNQREEARQLRQVEADSMKGARREVVDLTGAEKGTTPAKPTKKPATAASAQPTINKQPAKKQPAKSAAAVNAGKAAAARLNNPIKAPASGPAKPLVRTHPNVQVPTKLSDKSKEEQVMRCAHRVKPHVMAVDTLLRVLTAVRGAPDNPKFRTIDRSNANYAKYVRDKPGAEDLLLAMNYRRVPGGKNELRLERHLVDDALLYLGVSALEQMRTSPEYLEGKRLRAFHAEMRRVAGNGSEMLQKTGMTEGETAVRMAYLSKCPKEPPEGRGARMQVCLGDESEKIEGGRVTRRFDGDDTLEDVLNWLGGCYGSEVLDKIRGEESREWCLCDLNRYPILPLDVEKHARKTLQYLGLFPSGKLGVILSDDKWRERKDDALGGFGIQGSARGLGAASRSMLH